MKRLIPLLLFLLLCCAFQADAGMNAYIAGSVESAASCSYDFAATDTDSSNAAALNYRIPVAANALSCSGTKIKITLEAHSTNASVISGTSVCVRDSTTDDCTSEPTRITWDTGSNGKSITAGTTATSDQISYTWTKTDEHFIHIYMADNGTQWIRRKNSSGVTSYAYTTDDTDFTMTQTWTSSATTENLPFMTKIECE